MKIYISGPMTGLPENNFPAFIAASEMIEAAGHEAVSPHLAPACKTWEEYMRYDIKLLCDCDAIYMLKRWYFSKGALLEAFIAFFIKIKRITLEEMQNER